MAVSRLPEGVPPDNKSSGKGETASFTAPDMATPKFARKAQEIPFSNAALDMEKLSDESAMARPMLPVGADQSKKHGGKNEDNLSFLHGPHPSSRMLILIAVGLFAIALAVLAVSRNQGPGLPDCASQPEWNQYNCRKN